MTDWSPEKYLAFANERARPACDLLAQVQTHNAKVIVDLGCGPGNSTALLRQAFPSAAITGVDASPAMIDRARSSGVAAAFEQADAGQWRASPDVDLVFSNALFQWIPNHMEVLRVIFAGLRAGAVLAIQMPDNRDEPSHASMRKVAQSPEWRDVLQGAAEGRRALSKPEDYHGLLSPFASAVDVWRTTYHHVLEGHQGIIDMLSSTGLKPFLDPLNADQRKAFLERYATELRLYYPELDDGQVLLPFPRLFLVAIRAGNRGAN